MRALTRLWFDPDPVVLLVVVFGIGATALLALGLR